MLKLCSDCGSDKTYLNTTGCPIWYRYNDGYICGRCYAKLMVYTKRIKFHGKRIILKENPRTGQCQICHKKVGEELERTQIHHLEYHPEDPLKDTIELCASCHAKESWKLGQLTGIGHGRFR